MQSAGLLAIVLVFILILVSLSVHEAAHAWTADKLGDPTARMLGRVSLNPLVHVDWIGTVFLPAALIFAGLPAFGWAKPVPVNGANLRSPRRDFAIVAAAGPASNILMSVAGAAAFSLFGPGAGESDAAYLTAMTLLRFVEINVLLAVFNMTPIPPLDGGNVLIGLAPAPIARIVEMIRPHGFLVLIVLLYSGALFSVLGPVTDALLGFLL